MGKRFRWGFLFVLVGALAVPVVAAKGATPPAAAPTAPTPCIPPPSPGTLPQVTVGKVACQEFSTFTLGDGVPAPFEYYVPPACAPTSHRAVKCPVVYLLHGFGGDYTEMLGQPGTTTSAWVQAEDRQPPAGFESAPWNYYDPTTWQTATPDLPLILVAPLGQTLPGGYGPAPGMDSYWVDWNRRYALGGDQPRYATPAPQFEQFLTKELPVFVDSFLPVEPGRAGQAIAGVSLGGYGAFKTGLQHPDLYSSMVSVSGAMNFLFAPAPGATPPAVRSPIPITYVPLPGATGAVTTAPLPSQVGTFVTALDAFGDPAADQAYFRGNMPTDLAANGQGIGIDSFVNDMVPARAQDASSEPFELIVFPMNVDMQADFTAAGVPNTFAIHQGNHSDVYRNAWFRGLEQYIYEHTQQPDPVPNDFSYRTISTRFSIWGWSFAGHRATTEFLDLSNASCAGLTLSGSGTWTVSPPARCHHRPVTIDLGPSGPLDQSAPIVGETQTISFTR
jgi:S-formylglutathione hydrolase FrmB